MRGPGIAVALTGGASQIIRAQGIGEYRGFTIRELSGAVASFRLWDNPSAASGTIIEVISLAANEAKSVSLSHGIWLQNGLFLERTAGTNYEGSIRIG